MNIQSLSSTANFSKLEVSSLKDLNKKLKEYNQNVYNIEELVFIVQPKQIAKLKAQLEKPFTQVDFELNSYSTYTQNINPRAKDEYDTEIIVYKLGNASKSIGFTISVSESVLFTGIVDIEISDDTIKVVIPLTMDQDILEDLCGTVFDFVETCK